MTDLTGKKVQNDIYDIIDQIHALNGVDTNVVGVDLADMNMALNRRLETYVKERVNSGYDISNISNAIASASTLLKGDQRAYEAQAEAIGSSSPGAANAAAAVTALSTLNVESILS